jgi:chromosome segregation ATPase
MHDDSTPDVGFDPAAELGPEAAANYARLREMFGARLAPAPAASGDLAPPERYLKTLESRYLQALRAEVRASAALEATEARLAAVQAQAEASRAQASALEAALHRAEAARDAYCRDYEAEHTRRLELWHDLDTCKGELNKAEAALKALRAEPEQTCVAPEQVQADRETCLRELAACSDARQRLAAQLARLQKRHAIVDAALPELLRMVRRPRYFTAAQRRAAAHRLAAQLEDAHADA